MDWTESLRRAIDFMERNLMEDITADDAAKSVNVSSFYLQKGFKIMTGYTMSEYIRFRRLYLSALDIICGKEKIIDTAYKYGYDTPESFTKAFTRFHGLSPTAMRRDHSRIKTFLPLKIKVTIQGGNAMDFTVEKMDGFKIIGFEKNFCFDNSYDEIPKFWDELFIGTLMKIIIRNNPETEMERAVIENKIGEFGVCVDDLTDGTFRYIIGGRYNGGVVPEGMTIYEFPDMEWVKFTCIGPMPATLQTMNTRIFREWLPGNPEFEIAMGANIEWYSDEGKMSNEDYHSAIWIPVKRK